MKIFTELQMRNAEKAAAEAGMSFLRLMENAGSACAAEIRTRTDKSQKTVVLCGKGKSGGDGFVIARKLAEEGYSVRYSAPAQRCSIFRRRKSLPA